MNCGLSWPVNCSRSFCSSLRFRSPILTGKANFREIAVGAGRRHRRSLSHSMTEISREMSGKSYRRISGPDKVVHIRTYGFDVRGFVMRLRTLEVPITTESCFDNDRFEPLKEAVSPRRYRQKSY